MKKAAKQGLFAVFLLMSLLLATATAYALEFTVNCDDAPQPNVAFECRLSANSETYPNGVAGLTGLSFTTGNNEVTAVNFIDRVTDISVPPNYGFAIFAGQPVKDEVFTTVTLNSPMDFTLSITGIRASLSDGTTLETDDLDFPSTTISMGSPTAGFREKCGDGIACGEGLDCTPVDEDGGSVNRCLREEDLSCTSSLDCASNNCDDNICCAVNEENVAGKCVLSSAITGAATDIAEALRDNVQHRTFLQKIARIAGILRDLLRR